MGCRIKSRLIQTVAIAHLIVTVGRHTLPHIVLSVVSTPFLNANTAKPKALDEAQNYLARVSAQWDQALSQLKAFVEKQD